MGYGQSTEKKPTLEEFIRETDPAKQKQFDELVNIDDLKGFEFPFENLVMEGGGVKGIAYCGSMKVFEDLGMIDASKESKIKRIAGTSAGALSAALVAVGYSADEIMDVLLQDLGPIFLDSGYVGSAANLLRKYGLYKSDKYKEMMIDLLNKKTQPDHNITNITFNQVYKKYGKELCIIATDISSMSTAFFHPKTTPDRPIWEAARMSMSIPGLMTPFIDPKAGNYYVDGGLVRNYPVQVFDGWYLSMEPENSFIMKMLEKDETKTVREWEFGGGVGSDFHTKPASALAAGNKTVGLLLFSGYENDYKKKYFMEEDGYDKIKRPADTKLSKKRGADLDKYRDDVKRNSEITESVKDLLKILKSIKKKMVVAVI